MALDGPAAPLPMRFHLGAIPSLPDFVPDALWTPLRQPSPWLANLLALPIGVVAAVAENYNLAPSTVTKHMKNTLMIVLCSLGILASGCSKSNPQNPATPKKPDSVVLQGTWSGQEVGAKGQGSPSLTFTGTTLEFHGANPQEWYKATFTLQEDTSPKRLDAVVTDCPLPRYVGKTAHAIYKIEAGKFTLTGNEPGDPAVPASFDAQGTRQIVFTLKQ